jgi:hypothetical protein
LTHVDCHFLFAGAHSLKVGRKTMSTAGVSRRMLLSNSRASSTLAEAASFTGSWESCEDFLTLTVLVNTSSTAGIGKLTVDFSRDASSVAHTLSMPFFANQHAGRQIGCVIKGDYVRVTFTAVDIYDTRSPVVANDLATLTILTEVSQLPAAPDISLSAQIVQLAGVNTLASGTTKLLGTSASLDTLSAIARPSTGCALRVVNASGTNNSELGTGARTFLVTGLDANLNEIYWIGGLVASNANTWSNGNGVSQTSSAVFVAVNDISLLTYGSSGQADSGSTISVQINSNGWITVAQLSASNKYQCATGIYTVPSGFVVFPRQLLASTTSRTNTTLALNVVPYNTRQASDIMRFDMRGKRSRPLHTLSGVPTGSMIVLEGTSSSGSNTVAAVVTMLRQQAAVNTVPPGTTPTLTVDDLFAAKSYTEDTPLTLSLFTPTTSNSTLTITLTLSDTGAGSLNTGTSGAVTSTFSSGVWQASGAKANVVTLLNALVFTPTLNYNSNFTISSVVADGSMTLNGLNAVTGIPVDDPSYPTSGLVANFDATDPLATGTPPANGTLMSSWVDLVAGLTYAASTTERPTFVTSGSNSKNCLRFNGTSNVLTAQSTSLPWTTAASFFIVCTRATSNDRYLVGADNTDGNSPAIIVNYDNGGRRNFEWYFGRSGITERSILDTSSALTLNICAILRTNGGGAGTLKGYFNGTEAFSTASTADITGKVMRFIGAPSTLYLSSAFDGDICQIMMYNRIVDSTERAQITSYLANKWAAPTATNLSAAQMYTLNTSLAVTTIVISYIAGASVTATLTLSDTGAGTFNTGILDGVSSTFSSGVWSVSGAFETVNVFLATLMFTPTTGYTSSFTIATSVTNGSSAVTGSKAMALVGMVSGAGIYVNARDVSNNGGTLPSNGSTISTWYDMSGNSRNLIHDNSIGNQGTDPTIVYNTFGASPAVFYAGLRNRLILSTSYTPGTTATYVIYFKIQSGHTSDNMFLMGSLANASGRYQIIRYDGSAATAYIKQYNGNTNGVTSGMWWPITKSSSTAYTIIMRQSGTTGTMRINGVAVSNVGNGTTTGLTTMQNESHSFGSLGSIGIGSSAGSQTCNAYIGLMAIYNSALTDNQCAQIEAFISGTFV